MINIISSLVNRIRFNKQNSNIMKTKTALVCGAGGFIGSHLVKRLKHEGYWVRGVDLKYPEFSATQADDFVIGDLRDQLICREIIDMKFEEIYQLAADMGWQDLYSQVKRCRYYA